MDARTYLDLGGALAAFGLTVAVYQLRRESWDVVFRIRRKCQSNLIWIAGGLGRLSTLAGVTLSTLPATESRFPLLSPLTYGIGAYVCFIISPVSFLCYSLSAARLFCEESAERFYVTLAREISRSDKDAVDATLSVLLSNLRQICSVATFQRHDERTIGFSRAILDVILSDELVVRTLTTKRLDALLFILHVFEEIKVTRQTAGVAFSRIVRNLFCDSESFFFRHLANRQGFALASDIFGIFDSPFLLTTFDLFRYPTLDYTVAREFDLKGIEVYIEALSRSITTYIATGTVPARQINDGLRSLSMMFDQQCAKIREATAKDAAAAAIYGGEWQALNSIAHFLGHDYLFLADGTELKRVSERERTTGKADLHSDATINAGISAAIYKGFEALAGVESTYLSYATALDLITGMLPPYADRKAGYREPFVTRMWQQIAVNTGHRWYPAPIRSYLQVIGFFLVSPPQADPWLREQVERMRRFLYIDLTAHRRTCKDDQRRDDEGRVAT
jgi:hypothetical protein